MVADEKYVIGQHASERLEKRGFLELEWLTGKGKIYAALGAA